MGLSMSGESFITIMYNGLESHSCNNEPRFHFTTIALGTAVASDINAAIVTAFVALLGSHRR